MNKAWAEMAAERRQLGGPGEGVAAAVALAFDVRYTPWFWLSLLANLAGVLCLAAETFVVFAVAGGYPPARGGGLAYWLSV
jgi:hypothetical protein